MARTTAKKEINLQTIISSYPSWSHPSVHYQCTDWEILRDTFQGEREVKDKGEHYLPRPSGLDDGEYQLYLENATFYNMTNRTVGALVGTIFRRNPVVGNLPEKLKRKLRRITKSQQSLRAFARQTTKEVIHMGRYGVLVDRPKGGTGDPYLTGYLTESIVDWSVEMIDGREVLNEVVLMEVYLAKHTTSIQQRRYNVRIRILRMVNGQYEQHIYDSGPDQTYPDITRNPDEIIIPTNRGTPLTYIPFMFFGAESNSPDIERSSMLDIAQMNISHYRSYAHLEHGRFYTGLPVYYVSKADSQSKGEYTIGPSTVWEIGAGEKAGLIEFSGNGLKFLETAISTKEAHIATLGGRLIGVDSQSTSESDNQVSMKDRNEQALLLNVSMSLDEGFTTILQWWSQWQDVSAADAEEISMEFNKDFMLKDAAAREFRAVHQMYTDGILPIEVVFEYLKKGEVIPDWMELEEFKRLLKSQDSFINNPDADAKARGFPDRKTELDIAENAKDRKSQETQARDQQAAALAQARNKPAPGAKPPA